MLIWNTRVLGLVLSVCFQSYTVPTFPHSEDMNRWPVVALDDHLAVAGVVGQ
jgi:hypothetical protein